MTTPYGYREMIKSFDSVSPEIKTCFEHLPKLLQEFPMEVALGYVFFRIEKIQNLAILCGLVKLHGTNELMTAKIMNRQHITRKSFQDFFKAVFGSPLKPDIFKKIEQAQQTRDKVMHGKGISDEEIKDAIIAMLNFSQEFNSFIERIASFKPFGDLTAVKRRAAILSPATSKWVLKGMGFNQIA